jgi:hypothetical protein
MARSIRPTWQRISPGLEILPPTLLITFDHPWLGAATVGVALVFSALQSRMLVRAAEHRQQAILYYAQSTISMGGDPSMVIAALRKATDDAGDEGVSSDLRSRTYGMRSYDESRRTEET